MTTRYIDIDGYWGIILCYDFGWSDADSMAAIMDAFGMGDSHIREAMRVLYGVNSGMTISRSDLCMSAMFISDTTSKAQFFDTLAHEIDHVQDAICEHYDVALGTEPAAYLQGYIVRQMASE